MALSISTTSSKTVAGSFPWQAQSIFPPSTIRKKPLLLPLVRKEMALSVISASVRLAFLAVDGIGQARRLCPFFLDKNHLVRLDRLRLIFVKASCNGITGFFKDREDARTSFLSAVVVGFKKPPPCIEVETGFRQVEGLIS